MSAFSVHPNLKNPGFWLRAGLLLGAILYGFNYIGERWLIGIDPQKTMCLPGRDRIYLIDRYARRPWRGDIIGFHADERTLPYFGPGTIMVKRVVAVPGDHVVVNGRGVLVNGELVAEGLILAEKLGKKPETFYREVVVPPGHYWVSGTNSRSFDSRYWGMIREEQIVGIARPVPKITGWIQNLFELITPEARAGESVQDPSWTDSMREIRDKSKRVLSERPLSIPENRYARQARQWVREMLGSSPGIDPEATQALLGLDKGLFFDPEKHKDSPQYSILVSTSLGRARLRELFSAYAGRRDVRFVFQGLLEGQRIEDFAAMVVEMTKGIDPPPNVTLNPLVFRRHDIQAVPVMIAVENGRLTARIDGLVNIEWLERRLKMSRDGKPLVATLGQTTAIAERNLVDVIRERLAAIDWEKKKQEALERFWKRQMPVELPKANRNRRRLVNPAIYVDRDIRTPDGQVIAKAGKPFNPLDHVPFRQALLVFDASDPPQVEWASHTARRVAGDGLLPVLIATRFPAGKEWKTLERLENRLGYPVYLLTRSLARRFEIKRVPSLIRREGDSLSVFEFHLTDG